MKFAKNFLKKRRWLAMFGTFFFVWSVASTREQHLVLEGLLALALAAIAGMLVIHRQRMAAMRKDSEQKTRLPLR